ncbi:MAG: hypothetical protein WCF06_12150 [Nitrososphaeraceae archaeon]
MSIPATPKKILLGLDFILGHFQEPIFPRKIMTKELGYQVEVFSKEEALGYFKSSNYQDCRINAYPPFTEYQGINRTPISFLMVDLDLKDFGGRVEGGGELEYSKKKEEKTSLSLEKALNKASEKIKKKKSRKEEETLAEIQPCYGQAMVTTYTNLLADLF